jgi:hypothetical protein
VPYLWEKTPDSELNPLSNPVLERNLSRWAEVYFGNPPEKRDQAISKLLQEIRSETLQTLVAEPARREGHHPLTGSEEIVCSACKHNNPPAHKFCRQCGAALEPEGTSATVQAVREVLASSAENEVQWLRDRSLGSLYSIPATPRRAWKYVVGGLMIAIAGFAYLQWAPKPQPRMATEATNTATQATSPAAPLPVEQSGAVTPPSKSAPAESKTSVIQPGKVVADAHGGHTAVQPASQKSSLLAPPTSPASEGDSGSGDLRLAQRYLGGSMGVRDSSEAAKLLWKAVRKQNTTAAVLLSDLYLRGDGVPKSCDQARLLLVAASKRGAAQAADQLQRLESSGCR